MKHILIAGIFCIFASPVFSQDDYYLWDKTWKPTKDNKKAAYFGRMKRLSAQRWQWDIYNYTGPLISSEELNNLETKTLGGTQRYYWPNGVLDSTGSIVDGHQQGDWFYYDTSGNFAYSNSFDKGVVVASKKADPEPKTKEEPKPGEVESSFPGGIQKWQRYIEKHLVYPERAMNARVMGDVIIQFIVTTEGKATESMILQSVEFSLDEAALALIDRSPNWNPASLNGVNVKSYKKQPIAFRFR